MQPTLQPMLPPAPLPVVHRPTTRLPRRHRSGFAPATVFEAALTDLAADRATGALHGSAGTVHLVDGEVVHAESPATPDVGTLLTSAVGSPPAPGRTRWPRPAVPATRPSTWSPPVRSAAANWSSATSPPSWTRRSSHCRRTTARSASCPGCGPG
ncbi:hypothetical protein ACFQ1I_36690 [Kitasatospora arboriphila]